MKNLIFTAFLFLGAFISTLDAQAAAAKPFTDYVGQYATYVTTSHSSSQSAETPVGTSEMRVTAADTTVTPPAYTVQITNTNAAGVANVKITKMSQAELDNQANGDLFKNCVVKNGSPSVQIAVSDMSFASCKFANGNTDIYVGQVPFTVLRSVSTAYSGIVYTTKLTDFRPHL
jgi:hypothetical protein